MWIKIVDKMYEEHDAQAIHEKIREIIESRRGAVSGDTHTASKHKLSREEITSQAITGSKRSSQLMYFDFQKVILDF